MVQNELDVAYSTNTQSNTAKPTAYGEWLWVMDRVIQLLHFMKSNNLKIVANICTVTICTVTTNYTSRYSQSLHPSTYNSSN